MAKSEKCVRCSFVDGSRFHVCIDPDPANIPSKPKNRTWIHRASISEAQTERWRETNSERDRNLIDRYSQGDISYSKLAKEFGISRSTVINVMKRATAAGAVSPRTPGTNIKNGG